MFWWAVLYVLSRIGLFKPYIWLVESLLNALVAENDEFEEVSD